MGAIAPQPLHFAQAIFRVIQDIRDLKKSRSAWNTLAPSPAVIAARGRRCRTRI
jgi:hypothetical protein